MEVTELRRGVRALSCCEGQEGRLTAAAAGANMHHAGHVRGDLLLGASPGSPTSMHLSKCRSPTRQEQSCSPSALFLCKSAAGGTVSQARSARSQGETPAVAVNLRLRRMSHGEPLTLAKPQALAGRTLLCLRIACTVVWLLQLRACCADEKLRHTGVGVY